MTGLDLAVLRVEHERVYITVDGVQTPGSCGTCVPRRRWPCQAARAADALEQAELDARNYRRERDAAHLEVAERTGERDRARSLAVDLEQAHAHDTELLRDVAAHRARIIDDLINGHPGIPDDLDALRARAALADTPPVELRRREQVSAGTATVVTAATRHWENVRELRPEFVEDESETDTDRAALTRVRELCWEIQRRGTPADRDADLADRGAKDLAAQICAVLADSPPAAADVVGDSANGVNDLATTAELLRAAQRRFAHGQTTAIGPPPADPHDHGPRATAERDCAECWPTDPPYFRGELPADPGAEHLAAEHICGVDCDLPAEPKQHEFVPQPDHPKWCLVGYPMAACGLPADAPTHQVPADPAEQVQP